MGKLTELDFCVLGVIWRFGPLSAYAVRKVFRNSHTASWSSSSGSLYPSIRRLLTADLVAATATEDRRGTNLFSVTTEGAERLKAWIRDIEPALGTATPDPIRTRAQFITCLSIGERAEFVKASLQVTSQALQCLQESPEGDRTDVLDQLGILGASLELNGRIEWLKRLGVMLPE